MKISLNEKIIQKETQIIYQLTKSLATSGIKYSLQYFIKIGLQDYRIDLYLPDFKLAIEIDELGHKDRDPIYEKKTTNRYRE